MSASSIEKDNPQTKRYFCSLTVPFGIEIHVRNRIFFGIVHVFGFYALYLLLMKQLPASMWFFTFLFGYFSGLGTTIGSHRLWTHKAFKAKLPLKILLAFMQTTGTQDSIFKWCRDHRLHHKYVETDADPQNARKGFWFAHMGWLFIREHPSVMEKQATIDLSDLDNDPVIRFQNKYYYHLVPLCALVVPMTIQHLFWPEVTLFQLFCHNFVWLLYMYHVTFLVSSVAHLWGPQPYDRSLDAREIPIVSMLTLGEGYHNYHHTFPWDYKTAELGLYKFNPSTMLINFFAWVGWAYDLKTVPKKIVAARARRTGDGSYNQYHAITTEIGERESEKGTDYMDRDSKLPPWGWGDEDIPLEDFNLTTIINPLKGK